MTRRVIVATAAVAMATGVAACGKAGSSSSSSSSSGSSSSASAGGKIGLLLPENQTTRYEKFDRPTITSTIQQLCPKCTVDYQNAANSASTQAQQVANAVTNGDKVLIVDPVDYKAISSAVTNAHAKGVKVVAFDRFAEGPIDAYTSFDNTAIGRLQGQALLQGLGPKANKSTKVVMIDGDPGDPNAAMFKAGAQSVLKPKVDVAYEQSGMWLQNVANQKMAAAITALGKNNIAGVYSANDGMAAGIVTALQGAGISGIPVTGQDAQIDGIQRIVAGTQYADIYKDYAAEGKVAAKMAVALLQGKSLDGISTSTQTSGSGQKVPSVLLPNKIITKDNIKQTVVAGNQWTIAQICTPQYAADCKKIGLQ
ncbi:sugar ABC transporter substrate-binding protein [Phaeacidiphilus oryzae]|uniref:sugar ABC transporter substrate-binding protein n=1 Tax=Phaeacidiphilus oryzae TaxID=348818 RepID=UPI002AFDFECE|nr:substrate-binding domain-containing protein [Phaeacidiphilus oryzae]